MAHVLEGSVRKQGNKVRITAKLIRVQDGYNQWSETYDGDLSDVFALQERIAQAIASKLQLTLPARRRNGWWIPAPATRTPISCTCARLRPSIVATVRTCWMR